MRSNIFKICLLGSLFGMVLFYELCSGFISEYHYFDKPTNCVVVELYYPEDTIMLGLKRYCKKRQCRPYLFNMVYTSYKKVHFYGDKSNYNVHFKIEASKNKNLPIRYLYMLVLDSNNFPLDTNASRTALAYGQKWLQDFLYYFEHIFLLEQEIKRRKEALQAANQLSSKITVDSTEMLARIHNKIASLLLELEKYRQSDTVQRQLFSRRKREVGHLIKDHEHALDSLNRVMEINVKRY